MTRDPTRQFTIGSPVQCSDGVCGRLRRVVIEPVDRVLTHLIVQPDHRPNPSRLIPLDVVRSPRPDRPDEIVLRCSLAEFEIFESALETHFLAGASGQWGYPQEQMLTWPHYRLGLGGGLARGAAASDVRAGAQRAVPGEGATHPPTRDRVPVGGLQVRRGDRVQALDGPIGRVQGLIVDRADHQVTHVLLDESHLWDHKRVAIPIGAVIDMTHEVRLDLTQDQVRDLPPVELDIQA